MRWNLLYAGMIMSLSLFAVSASSICIVDTPHYAVSELQSINNREAVIVDVTDTPFHLITDSIAYSDTVYLSDLRSELMEKYARSDIVVIAAVTKATRFIPSFTESKKTVSASDSVSVSIEMVLKGTVEPEWNFIAALAGQTYTLVVDPETGDSSVIGLMSSHGSLSYVSVINQRYLLFLDNEDIPGDPQIPFPMPLPQSPCENATNAYAINDCDEVYFDGFICDIGNKSVTALPELMLPLEDFYDEIITGTHRKNDRRQALGVTGKSGYRLVQNVRYNLLGRTLPAERRSVSLPEPAGVYLYRQNGSLRVQASVR